MPQRLQLVGRQFGRLKVTAFAGTAVAPRGTKSSTWHCLCSCGRATVVRGSDLVHGKQVSCGCRKREPWRVSHGHTRGRNHTAEYRAWASAKKRCCNQKEPNYQSYGGRGIRMCDRWLDSFEAFLADMGPKPDGRAGKRPIYSLDRIDVNGHYEPGNCRWATRDQQFSNLRKTRRVEVGGESLTVAEAARRHGISPFVVYGRLNNGWDATRALTEPVRRAC